jgi:flagellin-like protein
MLNKFLRREKGVTGLETAIILIVFVVVVAFFGYTALSAVAPWSFKGRRYR